MGVPKLGVTLYSFNHEYYTYKYSFDDCMAAVASLGEGQGVEVVGPQMNRGFPGLAPEFEARFKSLVERYNLRPSAYGAYADDDRFTGRWPTHDERIEYLAAQIRTAARLGFPVIRVGPTAPVLIDLIPMAEKYNVKMGIEIHAPMTIENIEPIIERVVGANSPYLGFTPDAGVFCHSPAQVYIDRFLAQGVPQAIVDHIVEAWHNKVPISQLREEVEEQGGGHLGELMVTESEIYFGHGEPKSLEPLLPYIVHVHGKFYGIDSTGTDSAVRFPEIISVLVDGGYDGFISCEYEGHHWNRAVPAIDQLRTVQAFIRSHLPQT
jgi:sugar phosphate isomerase/epimerase